MYFAYSIQVQALGNPEFVFSENGQDGILFIKALDVEGVKTFEKVELELDFATSTFTLKNIEDADTTIPDDPIETVTEEGVTIGLRGCKAEARTVFCHLFFTSNEFDRTIVWCGNSNNMHCGGSNNTISFDTLGNEYWSNRITLANKTNDRNDGRLFQTLIADVTVEATIQFDNISTRTIGFSRLGIFFKVTGNTENSIKIQFRDISFL